MRPVLVLTFTLATATGVPAEQHDRLQKKKPPALAVVRTWGDLFDQPILKLPDGVEVRAGLEAQQVPAYSAFLVYVLVNARDCKTTCGGDVGPLSVDLVSHNSKRGDRKVGKSITKVSDYADTKHLLFAMTVPAIKPGDFDFVVGDTQNTVVAVTPVTVTKDKAATWFDFWHPDKKVMDKTRDAGDILAADWGVAAPARAQPKCNGMLPLMTRPHQGREIPLNEPLPRWSFDNPDGQLLLSANERTLRVEATTALFDDPSFEHWLFRIWINGKLFEPTRANSRCGAAKQELERMRDPAKVLIADWDFTAKTFGARTGDTIAVQLLYCPDGFHEICERDASKKLAEKLLRRGNRLPLATDKVEFVVR